MNCTLKKNRNKLVCVRLRKIPKNLIVALDNYREIRHELLYGYSNFEKADAENAVLDAEDFLEEVEKLL